MEPEALVGPFQVLMHRRKAVLQVDGGLQVMLMLRSCELKRVGLAAAGSGTIPALPVAGSL